MISTSNYFNGEYIKPILITGIIFLIFHMLITWDNIDIKDDIIIPKFILNNNNLNQVPNEIIAAKTNLPETVYEPNNTQSLNNKYRIANKFDSNNFGGNFNNTKYQNDNTINDSKLSNQNIFISHKNLNKYGLKF